MTQKTETIKLGDPLDRKTKMGPLISLGHRDRVCAYIEIVKSLRAGIVWVNHVQPTYLEDHGVATSNQVLDASLVPWGMGEYLETKQVAINLDETPIGWY